MTRLPLYLAAILIALSGMIVLGVDFGDSPRSSELHRWAWCAENADGPWGKEIC